MRGRKPLPTSYHEKTGSYKKHPERRNPAEPKAPPGIPAPPEHLSPEVKLVWQKLSIQLASMNVLSTVDAMAFELLCQQYVEYRIAVANVEEYGHVIDVDGRPKRNPFDIVKERLTCALQKSLSEFGLTPSSRSRMEALPSQDAGSDILMQMLAARSN